jgi:serine/threonine-protein kinase PknK
MPTELTRAEEGADWCYQLERLAAEGASSQVWQGRAPDGSPVALKIGKSPGERARFASEAERLLLTSSTALPAVLDAGHVPLAARSRLGLPKHVPFLALEWLSGSAIDARTLADGERSELALIVARDIGRALADLHQAGIAHGDLKPHNVVLDAATRRARAVDLGLSEALLARHVQGATPRYLAPECRVPGSVLGAGPRDLWALGLTLAEIADRRIALCNEPARLAQSLELEPSIAEIVRALLRSAPGARPAADWVERMAARALGESSDAESRRARVEASLRRAYFASKSPELSRAARGDEVRLELAGRARRWLEPVLELFGRVSVLRGEPEAKANDERAVLVIGNTSALGQSQLLTRLLGPGAGRRVTVRFDSDAALLDHLAEAAALQDPEQAAALVLTPRAGNGAASLDPVALAIALSQPDASRSVLEAAERHVSAHPGAVALGLATARALRLGEEHGRALALLDRIDHPSARVEAAEVARRAGDDALALSRLDALDLTQAPAPARARAAAIRARLALKRGDLAAAEAALAGAPASAPSLEATAMLLLRAGDLAGAAGKLLEARPLAEHAEELARLEFLDARIAHSRQEYAQALAGFSRAAEFAVQAGAVLEEATYLSGVAAAATELGDLGQALAAAERAWLLYDYLGRPEQAARAALSRAIVYAITGAEDAAREAAHEALKLARLAGDRTCQAYAQLTLAEVSAGDRSRALEHAAAADRLLGAEPARADALRLAALRLRLGHDVDVAAHDRLASDAALSAEARLDWWGARAERARKLRSALGVEEILRALTALAGAHAGVGVRAPAFAAGAALAREHGDGERARRFARLAAEASAVLVRSVPAELAASLAARPWLANPGAPPEPARVSPEQIRDVETLVRSLTSEGGLKPLLNQVLDALVLWTGVERGLLLLSAPGDKLVPRAARNLARADLRGAQLDLSYSLARRAATRRETVVAVDAAGELPAEHHESVHALKLRSVLCIPLFYRGETLGVVYLDDRVRAGAFGPGELSWVELVASIASVAIGDARDQLLLKRALRRAERAEHKLGAALEQSEAKRSVAERALRTREGTRFAYDEIIGSSPAVTRLLGLLDRVTVAEVPVLVLGESGSGKELVARAIHYNGPRRAQPFVSENCAAIPETLLETTLFGHVKGAFTGASRGRPGLFSLAHGGTLFLDEIGEMSLGMQAKLLRVIETGEVRPVGGEHSQKVDVRVLGATQRDLEAMVKSGSFRQDLLFRLNVISVRVPPLRERREDVLPLMKHFLEKYRPGQPPALSRSAADRLEGYDWPGNVRELENEARRALVMAEDLIMPEHLSAKVQGRATLSVDPDDLNVRRRIDQLETALVTDALERTGGNQTRAAELLGLSRFGLQKMMKRLQIHRPLVSSV